ncbi:MAG: DUF2269 domain-containing protein [Candidatus Dormibacteraeota bacterium]|nr:DUF2269 domain-containing protein [Candidatus Dormibacteraeota bacterium]
MLFNIVKFFHILFVITALGANITYGVWQARAGNAPEHESFALRGVKFLDDRVANPAYLMVLATGLTLAWWHWSYTTHWIMTAIVLFVGMFLFALAVYSPALTRQIEALERHGPQSPEYRSVNLRATIFGIGVMVPILAILFLMVTKPSL